MLIFASACVGLAASAPLPPEPFSLAAQTPRLFPASALGDSGSEQGAPTTRGICGQYTPAGAPCLRKSSLSGSVGAKFAGDGWHEAAIRAKADHSGLHIVPPARRFWNSFAPQSRFANDGSEPIIGSAHDGNAYSDYYYGISSWDGGSGGTTATGYYYLQALVPRCTCRVRVVHATRIHACPPAVGRGWRGDCSARGRLCRGWCTRSHEAVHPIRPHITCGCLLACRFRRRRLLGARRAATGEPWPVGGYIA